MRRCDSRDSSGLRNTLVADVKNEIRSGHKRSVDITLQVDDGACFAGR